MLFSLYKHINMIYWYSIGDDMKNKKIYIIVIILILLFFVIGTYGRYIYNGIKNYYLSTKSFYFNSDKLSDNVSNYQLDNWSGVEPIHIVFNLDGRKNNLVSTPGDIAYDITYTCSSNVTCNSTKSSGVVLASQSTDSFEVTMSPMRSLQSGDEVWLDIEVNSTSPYKKSLKGKFTIKVATIGLSYEIHDVRHRPYLDFTITNTLDYYTIREAFDSYLVGDKIEIRDYLLLTPENKAKCASAIITLGFDPNILRLDMTSESYIDKTGEQTTILSDNNTYVNGFSFKVDAISSTAIRFYKLNTDNDYTYPFVTSTPVITFQAE